MRSLWLPILTLAFSVSSTGELSSSKPELVTLKHITTERAVIGSVADISSRYENGQPITVVHILEFKTDVFPKDPSLLEVRLCGDQSGGIEPAVHSNILLVYDLASHTRLTGCLSLITTEPWQDSSKWQTVTFSPSKVKRSIHLDKSIQGIINSAFAN